MYLRDIKTREELCDVDITTFRDAIRAKCYDCCYFNYDEVDACETYMCPLWCFRKGVKPTRPRKEIIEEARSKAKSKK